MSLADRILGGLRKVVVLEERLSALETAVAGMRERADGALADHERRLVRLETIVEIARPDGAVLRIAPRPAED